VLRALGDGLHSLLPALMGLLAVELLYTGLFGLDFLFGADLRVFGVYDADTERLVFNRYGHLLIAHQARVLAVYLGAGLGAGTLAQILIALWERSGVWPRHRQAHSAATPVNLPPSPWPLSRRIFASLGLGLLLHLFVTGRAIIARPALFSEALYDRGGVARSLMLALTHGRGVWLGSTLILGLAIFLLIAPLLTARGRHFLTHVTMPRLLVAMAALALVIGGLVYGFSGNGEKVHPAAVPQPKRPSLLLIGIDSLRADRVGPAARRITPTLYNLAEKSVVFDAAHVTVPRTFPSLVTLLTGRYPHHHGIRTMFPTLAERAAVPPALPMLLQPAGYRSAVLSDFCGEIFSRINLGFEQTLVPSFDARTIVLQRSLTIHKNLLPYVINPLGERIFPEMESLAELADSNRLAEQTVALLSEYQRTGAPFFLTVFFSSAHFPYAAPAPYYRRFTDPAYRGPFRYYKPPLSEPQSESDRAQVRALYDGAVASADDGIRKLLDGLHELGLDERTIVVVFADHGENLYDEPERGMGHGEHLEGDNALHVPLIVYDPVHHFPPHHVPGLVRDIDLLPTVLKLLDVEPPDGGHDLDGVSLVSMLSGSAKSLGLWAFHETELWFTPTGPGFTDRQRLPYPGVTSTTAVDEHDDIALTDRYSELVTVAKHRSLRSDRWKIIYRPTREGPRYSLFDVQNDPRELHDLAAERPAELQAMQTALFQFIAQDPKVVIERGYILPR
jgi:arylsulfatase A-like enzyme